jgi:hypothetical protein
MQCQEILKYEPRFSSVGEANAYIAKLKTDARIELKREADRFTSMVISSSIYIYCELNSKNIKLYPAESPR